MNIPFVQKCFMLAAVMLVSRTHGETISWYSPIPAANLTSANQHLDGGFGFQLGVFANGFIPTAGNMPDWAKNWVSAQATTYNPTTRVFDGMFVVTSNAAPFTKGAKAYIWYRASSATQDEWMLFRKSDWTWPGTDNLSPFPLVWNTADANEVIIGAVHPAGTPFLMKSDAVFSYRQWCESQLAGQSFKAPNDDPDHDGVPNLLEFIFGSSPGQAGAAPAMTASLVGVAGRDYLQVAIPRLRNRLGAVSVEVSDDLIHWRASAVEITEVANTAEVLVVRDKTAAGPGLARRFMRMKAVAEP